MNLSSDFRAKFRLFITVNGYGFHNYAKLRNFFGVTKKILCRAHFCAVKRGKKFPIYAVERGEKFPIYAVKRGKKFPIYAVKKLKNLIIRVLQNTFEYSYFYTN